MKTCKMLSGFLLGAGCASTFMGLLGLIFPRIQNAQFRLVMASFETTSQYWLVNRINSLMRFVMQHGWAVMLCGLAAATAGGFLLWFFLRDPAEEETAYRRPQQEAAPVQHSFSVKQENYTAYAEHPADFAPLRQAEPAIEKIITAFASAPLLERNRIEEDAPPPVQPSPYARPASTASMSTTAEDSPSATAMPSLTAASPLVPHKAIVKTEESETPVPSRIRSTMGKHRHS